MKTQWLGIALSDPNIMTTLDLTNASAASDEYWKQRTKVPEGRIQYVTENNFH